jgi:hypothetical protein
MNPRPAEAKLIRVYLTAIKWELASPIQDRNPATINQAMTWAEEKEQFTVHT